MYLSNNTRINAYKYYGELTGSSHMCNLLDRVITDDLEWPQRVFLLQLATRLTSQKHSK